MSSQPLTTESFYPQTQGDARPAFAPISPERRTAILDIIRGVAILLILLVNITNSGNSVYEHLGDARLLGWGSADQACWWFLRILIDGTQRGLLEILFGAGALILLRPTLDPNGPVAVADLYFRRNFWLILFGLFDVFALFWFGDILFPYGIAALLLFPLRRFSGKVLLAVALCYFGFVTYQGAEKYRHASAVYAAARQAEAMEVSHQALSVADTRALAERAQELAALHTPPALVAEERAARLGTLPAYARWLTHFWVSVVFGKLMPSYVADVFFSAVFGMALFRFGITQGARSTRFYLLLALGAYLPGLLLRIADAWTFTRFQALPSPAAVLAEPARLSVTVGHLALLHLVFRTRSGARLLAPFQAVGRVAFSCYLLQNFVSMWILFPGFALRLFGRFHWFGLTMLAFGMISIQPVLAGLWLRVFAIGPLEWLWRSLTYRKPQPFLRLRAVPETAAA